MQRAMKLMRKIYSFLNHGQQRNSQIGCTGYDGNGQILFRNQSEARARARSWGEPDRSGNGDRCYVMLCS